VSELAVPDDQHAVARPDFVEDVQGGRQRLREDGGLVADVVRDRVQVRDRQRQLLGERAVPSDQPEHGPALAVAPASGPARRARPADRVDLARDAPADPLGRVVRAFDCTDELVPGHARERVVPADHLEVGVAHAGEGDGDEDIAGARLRDILFVGGLSVP
jgi:hypothetical protein